MRHCRLLISLLGLGGVLMGAAACSSDNGQNAGGPYAAEISRAQQDTQSVFQRAVLVDGTISRSEYEEGAQKLVSCVQGKGIAFALEDPLNTGIYQYSYSYPQGDSIDQEIDTCRAEFMSQIEPLYTMITTNPDHLDPVRAIFDCVVRKKLASSGYSYEQFRVDNGIDSDTHEDKVPWGPDLPEYRRCVTNPAAP